MSKTPAAKASTTKSAPKKTSANSAAKARAAKPAKAQKVTDEQAVPKQSTSNQLSADDGLPIKMMNDRILVNIELGEGERRTNGGILIPATAQVGKRLTWAGVEAVGPNVRSIEIGDQVLFNPNDRYEVEVRGTDYIIVRERDIHAVAAERLEAGSTGLYI